MRREKKRESPLVPISEVLHRLFENSKLPLSDQFNCLKLAGKWSQIVGPTIGERSEPAGFKRGTLYVLVASSAWMNELVYFAPQVQEKVNEFQGKSWVKKVRFVLNRSQIPAFEGDVKDFAQKF